MFALLTAVIIGAVATYAGWQHWKVRDQDAINHIDAAILKVTGEEPLPLPRFDRIMHRVFAVLGFIIGPFFFLIGVTGIWSELT